MVMQALKTAIVITNSDWNIYMFTGLVVGIGKNWTLKHSDEIMVLIKEKEKKEFVASENEAEIGYLNLRSKRGTRKIVEMCSISILCSSLLDLALTIPSHCTSCYTIVKCN